MTPNINPTRIAVDLIVAVNYTSHDFQQYRVVRSILCQSTNEIVFLIYAYGGTISGYLCQSYSTVTGNITLIAYTPDKSEALLAYTDYILENIRQHSN